MNDHDEGEDEATTALKARLAALRPLSKPWPASPRPT